ncbi:MAG: hypothetical protein L0H96_06230 [Humibacillus sp.]|nr:hypothetical protein [Humibacillus sp.]MDN5776489.1 hypothetical protein [Humibacillus sp.]
MRVAPFSARVGPTPSLLGRRGARAARWAPATTALTGSVVLALSTGVSAADVTRFAVGTAWSVLLPGLVVTRWARPHPSSLLGEVATGFVVGLGLQLTAWAMFVGVGGPGAGHWLALYPLLFVTAGAISHRLRARLRAPTYSERVPAAAAWSLCAAYLTAIAWLWATVLDRTPLPPGRGRWYQDLYWHLSISAEARHSAPPEVPQVAGEPLSYHWFANAHMAADALVSGVDVLVVGARLWYLPVYAAIIVLTYLLAARLAAAPWAGVLAVALVVVPSALAPVRWIAAVGAESLIPQSPSQIFGLPGLLVLIGTLAGIVAAPNGGAVRRGEWILLMLFAMLSAGSKSSILPTVLAGLLLVLVVSWWRRRTDPTRSLAPTLAATALVALVLLPASRLLAGGSAGSTLGFLTAVDQTTALQHATALERAGVIGTPLLLSLAGIIGLLIAVQFAGVLLAWPLRHDPRAVLLAGCVLAGFGALMVVHHPGGSQLYFMRGVMPIVAVLTAWGAAHAVRREARSVAVTAGAVALGVVAGLAGWAAVALAGGTQQGPQTGITRLALALSVLAACAVLAVAFLRVRRRPPGRAPQWWPRCWLRSWCPVPSTADEALWPPCVCQGRASCPPPRSRAPPGYESTPPPQP